MVEAVILRDGTPADVHAVADLHVRGWQAAYGGLLPQFILDGITVADRETQWRSLLAKPGIHLTVAELPGASIVGFVSCGPSRDGDVAPATGEVYTLYIEPARIGTGLGRTLLDHAVADLRARGFTSAIVWALATNQRGRCFYERAGFAFDGVLRSKNRAGRTFDDARHRRAL